MREQAAFQAEFCDWRLIKGRKVVQVVFELPIEKADQAYHVLGGMPDPGNSVWCAVARLTEPAPEEAADKPVRARPATSPDKRLAKQAGMACSDPVFQKYLEERGMLRPDLDRVEAAASAVRLMCGVRTRSHIVPNSSPGRIWEREYGRFIAWRDVA